MRSWAVTPVYAPSMLCSAGVRRRIGARRTSAADPKRVKFKIDENLPVELVRDLRVLGYDADTVTDEGLRGAADAAVVDAALTADRVLFTLKESQISRPILFNNMRA